MIFVYHAGGDRCRVAAFGRDTPARGFGRASLVVGQRVFSSLLSHSRRYAIRRVRRLASLVVCRRVVWFCRGGARKMRAVRPILFVGLRFALSNDRARNSAPAAPRPMGHRARSIPVFVPTWSLPHRARRGGVWGCVIAFPNASPIPLSRAEGHVREKSQLGG